MAEPPERWVVLAGGVGGAKFVLGLRELARRQREAGRDVRITVIANTGDDAWVAATRVCADLDSIMYALAGINDTARGWGRAGDSGRVAAELAAYGVGWPWFTLGDLDLGTCLARASMLRDGLTLTEATRRITSRWELGVDLIPVTDDEVETHVDVVEHGAPKRIHFQEWWARTRATLPASGFAQLRVEDARITDAAARAISDAHRILIAPSNPVVSIGTMLGIPGVRQALASAAAPVVGVSPIIGGRVVRGMADACLTVIGVDTSARAVAELYGPRSAGGVLDGWLVDEADADAVEPLRAAGIETATVPLWMTDPAATARLAHAALTLIPGP